MFIGLLLLSCTTSDTSVCWHHAGHGKLILGDGGYYEGTFSNGEIEGHGFRRFGLTGLTYSGIKKWSYHRKTEEFRVGTILTIVHAQVSLFKEKCTARGCQKELMAASMRGAGSGTGEKVSWEK